MYNTVETDYDNEYFSTYPYAVEIFANDICEDVFRTDNLSTAQAKYDKWTSDLENDKVVIKMFMYNTNMQEHNEIDYNGNTI